MNSSESNLLLPWGGYKPCSTVTDCIVDKNGTSSDIAVVCAAIIGAPYNGMSCRCDSGLGGIYCDQLTSITYMKLVIYLIVGSLALCTDLVCLVELFMRGKPKKLTSIVLSLYLGVAACTLGTSWCAVGASVIFEPTNPSVPLLREVLLFFIVPAATSCPLASVLVITLAWQKVLLQSQMKRKKQSSGLAAAATNLHRNLVIFACVLIFGFGGFLISFGMRTYASILVCLLYGISAGFLVSKGKQFAFVMSTGASPAARTSIMYKSTQVLPFEVKVAPMSPAADKAGNAVMSPTKVKKKMSKYLSSFLFKRTNSAQVRKLSKLEKVCLAAREASREAAMGMLVVFISTLLYALLSAKPGFPSQPHGIEWPTIALSGVQVGNSLTALAAVNYAKKARLIGKKTTGNMTGTVADRGSSVVSSQTAISTQIASFKKKKADV